MSAPVEVNRRSGFSRPLRVEGVAEEGLDLSISATETERQAIAAEDGLEALTKLEAALHVAPWRNGGLAVTGEMRARITQICVVTLDPFDSEIVEPIDVKFAPAPAAVIRTVTRKAAGNRAPRAFREAAEAPATTIELQGDDPPEPIIDGQIDLGALVAEFLALGLNPYPRKPGVEFEEAPAPNDAGESPFAKLEVLKRNPAGRG
jgi:uncharacterized metal-binding protein YceD (DUF177 family)